MSGKKKHRTAHEYLQYLRRDLSSKERYSFERDLEADPFEKEALEGLDTLTPDQAEEDILSLHARLRKRKTRKRRIAWYSAAASIASLLIIGTVFLQIYDFNPETVDESIYKEEFAPAPSEETEEPSFTEETAGKEMVEQEKAAETGIPERETEDEGRGSKAPVPDLERSTEKGPAEAPPQDQAKGPTQVIEAQDAEIQATEAQAAEIQAAEASKAERIVYKEAEAEPLEQEAVVYEYMAEDDQEPETRKRADRRTQQVSQPAAVTPEEMEKKAVTRDEFAELVSRQISGKIVSGEDMQPIPGASVAVKGSNLGVVTNMDGNFILPLEDDSNNTLVASFVGMETKEYQFTEGKDIRLVMQPDAMTLDEVVVVGQGMQPAAVPTGAYSTVKLGEEDPGTTQSAQPSVGYRAFKSYMEENMHFPTEEPSIDRAVVVLKFTVTTEGNIKEIMPLRSPGESFTNEAIRLVKEGPSWNPASDESGTIEEIVRLRIVFKK